MTARKADGGFDVHDDRARLILNLREHAELSEHDRRAASFYSLGVLDGMLYESESRQLEILLILKHVRDKRLYHAAGYTWAGYLARRGINRSPRQIAREIAGLAQLERAYLARADRIGQGELAREHLCQLTRSVETMTAAQIS